MGDTSLSGMDGRYKFAGMDGRQVCLAWMAGTSLSDMDGRHKFVWHGWETQVCLAWMALYIKDDIDGLNVSTIGEGSTTKTVETVLDLKSKS